MADQRSLNRQAEQAAIRLAMRHPRQAIVLLVVLGLILLGFYVWAHWPRSHHSTTGPTGDGKPGTVLLCAWNAENFFDDQDDPNVHDEMEDWFGSDPVMFRAKVDHLAEGLLLMNGGAGPDVVCLCEVENERCLEALRDALNPKLGASVFADRKYTRILFKGDKTGRHFAPGILTRLGVIADRTRKLNNHNGRILEGHIESNGYDLVVIAAHWTSRVSDKSDDGHRRLSYANDCYGRVRAILREDPDADVVVCGDFNDEFKDESMQAGLKVRDNAETVRASVTEPRLLDLFAHWTDDPQGTIYARRKWSVFDHICVTRGLLDTKGWSCDPATARIFAADELRRRSGPREPLKFGHRNDTGTRGYSDHFPVTVQLQVAGANGP
jgi:endonuclease/exonuclease/phosphatase family metal-dependent hydrolase